MYHNNDLSDGNKENNISPEDYEQKVEEQQQEQHWAYKLFVEHPELFLSALERAKEKAVREVEGLCKIFDEYDMPKDSKILDLSCGIGRHSIPLAKRGYKVIGYDISPVYLQKAREWAKGEGLINDNESNNNNTTIKFYQGDLRDAAKILSANDQTDFNAVINMETSIGYFGEETDYQLFKDLANISSSSSSCSPPILVIDTINRDYLVREFQPIYIVDEKKLELQIKRKLNLESSYVEEEWKFYDKRTKRVKNRNNRISSTADTLYLKQLFDIPVNFRVYSLHELIRLLKKAGWNCTSKYGDIVTLEPFNQGSHNMVLVSQKKNI